MSIHSDAFGRVTLTNDDARKFEKQIRYGRPNQAAKDAVKKGSDAVKEYQRNGVVRISLKNKAK